MSEDRAPQHIPYAEWGELFFETAVTEERVVAGVNVMAGRPIDVGPLGVGPAHVAKVTATGSIGTATGRRVGQMPLTFHVDLPVHLDLLIDLGVDKHRFQAEVRVPLVLTAQGRSDLAIELVVTPPRAHEVAVEVEAQGMRASLMQKVAGVDVELRRFVAKYVAREVEQPHVLAARVIDIRSAIDRTADARPGAAEPGPS